MSASASARMEFVRSLGNTAAEKLYKLGFCAHEPFPHKAHWRVVVTSNRLGTMRKGRAERNTYMQADTKPTNKHNRQSVTIFECMVLIHFVEFCKNLLTSCQALELFGSWHYSFSHMARSLLPKNSSEGVGFFRKIRESARFLMRDAHSFRVFFKYKNLSESQLSST